MHRCLLSLKISTRFPPEKFDTGEIASYKDDYCMCKKSEQKPTVHVHGNLYRARKAWNFSIDHVKRKLSCTSVEDFHITVKLHHYLVK